MQSSALEGQSRKGVDKKKDVGRLLDENEGLGYLRNLDSQKSGVARICDSEENTAELLVEGLRLYLK